MTNLRELISSRVGRISLSAMRAKNRLGSGGREGRSDGPQRCRCTRWRRSGSQRSCGCGQRPHAECRGRRWRRAGRKQWIETGRDRIDTRRRFTRLAELIVDLDESHLRELFEIDHQRTRDGIKRTIRLATASQINVHAIVHELHFAVARKTVVDHCKPLVSFHVTGTFEEFIEHGIDHVLRRGDVTCHANLIGKFTGDQTLVIGEINVDPSIQRRARRRGDRTRRSCQRRGGAQCTSGRWSQGWTRRTC